ncbi:MAG: hypothetical protein PHX18_04335 [Candidatus Gastranaerophilales bacterium]|nr:hypothetical protein [Candidatus Gastranaerophilales bacterium]
MEEQAENFYNLLKKVGTNRSFKTPLGSHKNYIEHIVLRNCQDYITTAGIINDNLTPLGKNKREEFRHYFNAIVSMEQILDYLYFETKDNYKIKIGQSNFKKNILNQHPILKEISETANAFKHCITNNPDKKNAKDAVTSTIKTNISLSKGLQDITQEFNYDSQILIDGFNFWWGYVNGKIKITFTEGA